MNNASIIHKYKELKTAQQRLPQSFQRDQACRQHEQRRCGGVFEPQTGEWLPRAKQSESIEARRAWEAVMSNGPIRERCAETNDGVSSGYARFLHIALVIRLTRRKAANDCRLLHEQTDLPSFRESERCTSTGMSSHTGCRLLLLACFSHRLWIQVPSDPFRLASLSEESTIQARRRGNVS